MENKKPNRFYESVSLPLKFVLLLWVIHIVQFAFNLTNVFASLGIHPRDISGLKGIFFAPLIHGDFGHLLSNTPPLFFLSLIIMFFYRRVAVASFIMIYLLTGLAVWIFGRPYTYHIGASGVIYGLVAFVFWNGIFRRNIKSIVLALIVVFYYGSMVVGILPNQEGISWESHLLGGFVGIFASFWYKGRIEADEEKPVYSWEKEEEEPAGNFLDPDTFQQTRAEREEKKKDDDQFSGWFSNRTW